MTRGHAGPYQRSTPTPEHVGLTGMIRPRPALREALAAARGGDTLVVTALSRLTRSVPDAYELLNGLAGGEVTLAIGQNFYPPSLPVTHVLVEVLARTAQLQTGLDSRRTRVGLAAARIRGQLRGRPPKLNHRQEHHIVGLYSTGHYRVREIGELFNVSRSTVYRAVRRADRTADSDAAHSAGEPAPGCSQHWTRSPRRLMCSISTTDRGQSSLHPDIVVEMQPKFIKRPP